MSYVMHIRHNPKCNNGCLAAVSGQRGNIESYNLLTFRKLITENIETE